MEKLLNLFTGITLVATTASTVVICDNNKSNTPTEVDKVFNKINNKNIIIDAGSDADVNNTNTKRLINQTIKNQFNLTDQEIQTISYDDSKLLEAGISVAVKFLINIGGQKKEGTINIILAQTLEQQA